MNIFADLKLKGIETDEDFRREIGEYTNFRLDDLHFNVPAKVGEEIVSLHLDFNEIQYYFDDNRKVFVARFIEVAETWNDLNLEEENGYDMEEVTVELLKKGWLENYVLFFVKKDESMFTDIEIAKIGYLNENMEQVLFEIGEEAINEADMEE